MKALRLFLCLLRWDILRELRRKESVLNMILFGVLVLFLVNLGMGPLFSRVRNVSGKVPAAVVGPQDKELLETLERRVGPIVYWIAVLFAGTVGLSQSFAAEREGGAIVGISLAPVDLGMFYLAKVAATWLYVMLMELCLLAAYVVLFHFDNWGVLGPQLVVLGVFTLGYTAAGVVLAAMTSGLRGGGEVVLRILLFPLLIPLVNLTLRTKEATFGLDVMAGAGGAPFVFWEYVAMALAFDAIYLATGFLIFPKILEE